MIALQKTIQLAQLAHARSGDKADWVDFGLFAWNKAGYRLIEREVTADRVRAHFAPWLAGEVEAWTLPNILAIKLVLKGALQGGGARNLRLDNLGKAMAGALLPCAQMRAHARRLIPVAAAAALARPGPDRATPCAVTVAFHHSGGARVPGEAALGRGRRGTGEGGKGTPGAVGPPGRHGCGRGTPGAHRVPPRLGRGGQGRGRQSFPKTRRRATARPIPLCPARPSRLPPSNQQPCGECPAALGGSGGALGPGAPPDPRSRPRPAVRSSTSRAGSAATRSVSGA